jgi:hypothetical protein
MSISSLRQTIQPTIVTSSTRPASPYEGQFIYETDTDGTFYWTGAVWSALTIPAVPWISLTGLLVGGWVAFESPAVTWQAPEYRKVGDQVQIRGMIKSGVVPSTAFTLPAGYRPLFGTYRPANSIGVFGGVRILQSGEFRVDAGNTAWIDITCEFSTI